MKVFVAALVAAAFYRRARPRYNRGLAAGTLGIGGNSDAGEGQHEEGQEKEGEEIYGRGECVRRVAHEVNKVISFPVQTRTIEELHMNKFLVALIAGVFASVAAAQTATPTPTTKEKQKDVQSTTAAAAASTTGAQTAKEAAANTAKSKDVSKMTAAEKNAYAKEVNKMSVNPENPSGNTSATAAQQKANTAESKATPKQNTELKTKEGQKALEKDLQKKSTGQ